MSVALTCAAALAAGLPATAGLAGPRSAPPPAESSTTVREQVQAMQREVEQASKQLADGARTWEEGRARLDRLLQEQFAADRVLETTDADLAVAQRRLNAIANAAYRNPVPQSLSVALSLDMRHLTESLETVQVLRRTRATQREVLNALAVKRTSARELAARRDRVRRQAQEAQADLDRQVVELQALAVETNARLQAAQARLERVQAQERARAEAQRRAAQAASAAAQSFSFLGGGAECSAPADGQYANGFLPPQVLCPLDGFPGQRLAGAAAEAFNRLNAARVEQTGTSLCISDSYRDFAGQVDVFARKPSLAATPGTSQHGWGLALDLGCGAERFNTEMYRWLKANAPAYGWVHPAWAEPGGGRPEPWHWEYQG